MCRLLQRIIYQVSSYTPFTGEGEAMSKKKCFTKFVRSVDWSDIKVNIIKYSSLFLFCTVICGISGRGTPWP